MFGYSFAAPAFLYGLAAIAAPIIIHFLFKARKQTIIFSSVRFILESVVRKSSRIRFKELLLLLLRVGIFALVVLAFARPFRRSEAYLPPPRGALDAVIVLDDSYSMGYIEAGRSRFEMAKEMALRQIEKFRPGDRVGLLRATGGESAVVKPTPNFQTVSGALRQLNLSMRAARFAEAVRRAVALLEDSAAEHKLILFISDFQWSSWAGLETAVRDLPQGIAFRPLQVGRGEAPNLAVLNVQAPEWGWVQGSPLELKAHLANYGSAILPHLSVSLHVDERKLQERVVDLPAGEKREVRFTLEPMEKELLGWVQISANDNLPLDDRHFFHVATQKPLRVLCVEDAVSDVPYFRASYYLQTALNPATERHPWPSLIVPMLVDLSALEKEELAAYHVVCLVNVSGLSEQQVERLEQFVGSGGGALIFLGEKVEPTIYNHRLYKHGTGLLPGELGEIRKALTSGSARAQTEFWRIGEFDRTHHLFQPFLPPAGADLSLAQFERFFTIAELSPERARVLAKFDDGTPAILEKEFGKGRVLLFTSTADAEWTNFPKKPAYPALVHRMVRHLTGQEKKHLPHEARVGEAIRLDPDELGAEHALLVKLPDGREARLEIAGKEARAIFSDTELPGIYTIRADSAAVAERLVVNLDTRESDLACASPAIVAQLAKGSSPIDSANDGMNINLEPELRAISERLQSERTAQSGPGPWQILLIGALLLMLVELLLANRVGA